MKDIIFEMIALLLMWAAVFVNRNYGSTIRLFDKNWLKAFLLIMLAYSILRSI